jgi:hypothetical protein
MVNKVQEQNAKKVGHLVGRSTIDDHDDDADIKNNTRAFVVLKNFVATMIL